VASRADRYGDPLPPGAVARMGTVRFAQGDCTHGYPVLAPDLKSFVTVSRYTPHGSGSAVCLWDAETGKELRHFQDPDFEIYRASVPRTETLLVPLGSPRKPVRGDNFSSAVDFRDPVTGKRAGPHFESTGLPFEPLAISHDEKVLASAGREPPVLVRDRTT